MSKKPTYDEKYCPKHNQRYAEFLDECPVCVGEKTKFKTPKPKEERCLN